MMNELSLRTLRLPAMTAANAVSPLTTDEVVDKGP